MGALSFHIGFSIGFSIVFWFVVVLSRRFSVVVLFRKRARRHPGALMGALSFDIGFSVGFSVVFWFAVVLFRRFSVVVLFSDKGLDGIQGHQWVHCHFMQGLA